MNMHTSNVTSNVNCDHDFKHQIALYYTIVQPMTIQDDPGTDPGRFGTNQDDLGRTRMTQDDSGRTRTIQDKPGRPMTNQDDPGRTRDGPRTT